MKPKGKTEPLSGTAAVPPSTTLRDVFEAVEGLQGLSITRRRDLRSAVNRIAALLDDDPGRIALDIPAIGAKLAAISPVAAGLSIKSFSNVKSDFMAAVKASKLKPLQSSGKTPMSPAWINLVAQFPHKRDRIGLSRLARHASAMNISPKQVDDGVINNFIAAVRDGSLHRKPNALHRMVTRLWNTTAQQPGRKLQAVAVPSFRPPVNRIKWLLLTREFRNDVDQYLAWCSGSDAFAADARSRALKPQTLKLRRDQIHAGVSALIHSGVKPSAIKSLADLLSPDHFTRILRRRQNMVGDRENRFNGDLARALIHIALEWVHINDDVLTELRRLAGKVPTPAPGLTAKNKRFLRQFDDPAVLQRLHGLPARLWAEIKRESKHNQRTLAKAQVAIAVAILCYMPVRLQNLSDLTFDLHLFLREGARATSTLELSADEVKNRSELAFDIPLHVAKMLLEYRNNIAPRIIGHRPERLFVTVHGTPKSRETLAVLLRTYLNRRAGIVISAHQFRHLSAKILLDAEPGSFETVRQLLGHTNMRTTVGAYAGIDSRRAARHHQHLVEEALATRKTIQPSRNRVS